MLSIQSNRSLLSSQPFFILKQHWVLTGYAPPPMAFETVSSQFSDVFCLPLFLCIAPEPSGPLPSIFLN